MIETLKNVWKLPHLRKKLIFTVGMLVIIRIGTNVMIPFLDPVAIADILSGHLENPFATLNAIMGSEFGNTVVLALGVTPYINASIVLQLLGIAFPALGELQKEGEAGRHKFERINRYTTFAIAFLQSVTYLIYMNNQNLLLYKSGFGFWFTAITIVLLLMAGTAVVIWIGEQMNELGIGSGISMIIFAGILSNLPTMFYQLYADFAYGLQTGNTRAIIFAPILLLLYIAMMIFIIFITQAERRIPINYAKRQVGRKMYGGQSSYIPLKVNMSGVLPVIFASTFLSIPTLLNTFLSINPEGLLGKILNVFNTGGLVYALLNFVLIFAFNYFYTSVQYNTQEIANNLRKNSGGIHGIRPGASTAAYIQKVVSRITFMGGLFLGLVAILPQIISMISGLQFSMAGTSIIILVGVAIETVRAVESQMTMRNYKGFLE